MCVRGGAPVGHVARRSITRNQRRRTIRKRYWERAIISKRFADVSEKTLS